MGQGCGHPFFFGVCFFGPRFCQGHHLVRKGHSWPTCFAIAAVLLLQSLDFPVVDCSFTLLGPHVFAFIVLRKVRKPKEHVQF